MTDHTEKLLTVEEAAAELHVSGLTVRRWIKAGRLQSVRTNPLLPRSRLRVRFSSVRTLIAGSTVSPKA